MGSTNLRKGDNELSKNHQTKDDSKYLLNSFFDGYISDLKDRFNDVISEIESPIEQMLCGVLLSEALLQCHGVAFQGNHEGVFLGDEGPDEIRIYLQHQIDRYRVDFYITYWHYDPLLLKLVEAKKLIIECDGHDFHEKTKEQAVRDKKRDRTLQAKAPVFRFTGSEIWKDPHDCAYQIINHLIKD